MNTGSVGSRRQYAIPSTHTPTHYDLQLVAGSVDSYRPPIEGLSGLLRKDRILRSSLPYHTDRIHHEFIQLYMEALREDLEARTHQKLESPIHPSPSPSSIHSDPPLFESPLDQDFEIYDTYTSDHALFKKPILYTVNVNNTFVPVCIYSSKTKSLLQLYSDDVLRGSPTKDLLLRALSSLIREGGSWPHDICQAMLLSPSLDASGTDIPVFSSVYTPKNKYVEALMELALPLIKGENPRILVMGTGSGREAVTIARRFGVFVDAVDINPLAVANTRASALWTGTQDKVRSWVSDAFFTIEDTYDYILFNCPPVTTGWADKDIDRNTQDPDGALLKRVLAGLPRHLKKTGKAWIMNRDDIDRFIHHPVQGRPIYTFSYNLAIHEISLAE